MVYPSEFGISTASAYAVAVCLTLAAGACGNAIAVAASGGGFGGVSGSGGSAGSSGSAGASGDSADDHFTHVDLSETGYLPPIGNQGTIGACDWFAAVYYQMTYAYNKQYGRSCDSSNTFSPKFGYNLLNNAGPYPANIRLPDVYEFAKRHGSATLAEVPYDMANGAGYRAWCTDPEVWLHALKYRIEGYAYVEYRPSAVADAALGQTFADFGSYFRELKRRLSDGEVLVFQSNPDPSRIVLDSIADDPTTTQDDALVGQNVVIQGEDGPDHTMAMVGFDDRIWVDLNRDGAVQANEKGAFKIADSFGTEVPLHNQGYLWLAYSTLDASIYLDRFYRMFVRDYTPQVVTRITLNHPERDKLKFQFGRSRTGAPDGIDASLAFDPYGLGYELGKAGTSLIAGGNCAFDGGVTAMDAGFAFDLTDIAQQQGSDFWYLRILNDSDKPLIIKQFQVINVATGSVANDDALPVTVLGGEEFRFIPKL